MRYEDTPIRIYRIAHTMGNTAGGGARGGSVSVSYTEKEFRISSEDSPPTRSGMAIQTKMDFMLTFFRISVHLRFKILPQPPGSMRPFECRMLHR
jgi:hypothetical protein